MDIKSYKRISNLWRYYNSIIIYKCFSSDLELGHLAKQGSVLNKDNQVLMTNTLVDTQGTLENMKQGFQILTESTKHLQQRVHVLETIIEADVLPRLITIMKFYNDTDPSR